MKILFIMLSVLLLMGLVSVLFITLLERKMLGILNNRKAPNFFIMNSLIQSLMDFVKLISKKSLKMNFVMKIFWNIMIFYGLMMMILLMMNFPLMNSFFFFYINFVFFFLIYSLMSYFFLMLSYSSNSFYSMMSLYRVLVQILSYEVGLIFIFLIPLILLNLFNYFFYYNYSMMLMLFSIYYINTLLIISLSEMNRIPFDFLESETELVSGFNVEYMNSLFSMIFLIEYGFFIYYGIMLTFMLLTKLYNILMIIMVLILIRSFIPRYRYDKMMYFFWKDILLLIFSFYLMLNIY